MRLCRETGKCPSDQVKHRELPCRCTYSTSKRKERNAKHRTLLVFRLLQKAVVRLPLPANEIGPGLGRPALLPAGA